MKSNNSFSAGLLEKLDGYTPASETINDVLTRAHVDERHERQARRMLRQKMRLAQVEEVIETDRGTDIVTGHPIVLRGPTIALGTYDSALDDLFDNAVANRCCAVSIDRCLHIGAGFGATSTEAKTNAMSALNAAIEKEWQQIPNDLKEKVLAVMPREGAYKSCNAFMSNLYGMTCRPFTLWGINRRNVNELMRERLCMMSAFDLTAFLGLCRSMGIDADLSTKSKAADILKKYGRQKELVVWNHRLLGLLQDDLRVYMGAGMLGRFFMDLTCPKQYLEMHQEHS